MGNSNPIPSVTPRTEYARRLDAFRQNLTQCERRHRNYGTAKLVLGGAMFLMFGLALATRQISALWAFGPLIAIAILDSLHGHTLQRLGRSSRAAAYYERALARLDNRWMGTGETGEHFQDAAHPYSRDLDLFGQGSLFQLLCAARTREGKETLARWLLAPAPPQQVAARQAALVELQAKLDFREDLAVLAEHAENSRSAESLAAWGEGQPQLTSGPLRWAISVLAALWLASLMAWAGWGLAYPALLISALNLSLTLRNRPRYELVLKAVQGAADELGLLAGVLARIETESFQAPLLVELRTALESSGSPPSQWIARLKRLVASLDSRRNMIVRVIDPFAFWSWQCAYAIEGWRRHAGPALRRWLVAAGEVEALSSLAGYAYEHPADAFPEFTEASPCFEAEGLAHPLLPDHTAVCNDVCLGREVRALIISGPNMAGKSTFVRAVGINAVLAQCGAPVRAHRLRLSPLAVGASICVLDSLQGGVSHFYAEIKRLKQIVDLTGGLSAVLFLLDEFLQGTNSHDRRRGAEAMVRSLVERGAIGLVTTHDLALAEMVPEMGSRAANVHFEDHLEDGKLVFNYKLQAGIVKTSNALNLMRSIGLDV